MDRPDAPPPALDVLAGLLAALLVSVPELWLLAGTPGAASVAGALALPVGLALGGWLAVARVVGARLGVRAWRTALVAAAGSLIVTIPVGRHLFDGAFAATLPGARFGPVWFPLGSALALAVALRLVVPWVDRPWRRTLMAALVLAAAVATDVVDRNAYRTEYPDIHMLLLVFEVTGVTLALRLVIGPRVAARGRGPWLAGATGLVSGLAVIGAGLAIAYGLQDRDDRWAIATQGMHGRMLVRSVRLALDFDGDKYSPCLGGGDCNDDDPEIHPGARELVGNDVDENCDGVVATGEVAAQLDREQAVRTEALAEWSERPEVTGLLTRTRAMNVLILSVDALRADVLADTEQNRADFPELFALRDDSRAFTRAFAPAAGTDLSISGMLTGRIDPFVAEVIPLATAIGERRASYAVIPREVIRYVGKAIITRSLTRWDRLVNDRFQRDVGSYTTSHRTTELGLAQLARHRDEQPRAPWLLWLHYFDVHEHDEVKLRDKHLRRLRPEGGALSKPDKYRLLVKLVDEQIGVVRRELEARGEWQQTVVVFASDHGEGLGEDPRLPDNHGRFLYNPLTHVPLWLRIPGVEPRAVEAPVSLLDVYPTLLELLGVPPGQHDAASLLPFLIEGAPESLTVAARALPLNESDQFGVVRWPYKLMVRRDDNLAELYDLSTDFAEQHDLSQTHPERVTELLSVYAALPAVEIDRTTRGRRRRERAVLAGLD